mgnify:FL=1|tara:strand:+ start:766 stop:1179 length:414 start_codon:yes stop_codon:yes gene_type:complete
MIKRKTRSKIVPHPDKLVAWINRLVGPGKKFKSQRNLSASLGLSTNTVSTILATKFASTDTIALICDAADESVIDVFINLEMFEASDLEAHTQKLNLPDDEIELLKDYRQLDGYLKTIALSQMSGLRQIQEKEDSKS